MITHTLIPAATLAPSPPPSPPRLHGRTHVSPGDHGSKGSWWSQHSQGWVCRTPFLREVPASWAGHHERPGGSGTGPALRRLHKPLWERRETWRTPRRCAETCICKVRARSGSLTQCSSPFQRHQDYKEISWKWWLGRTEGGQGVTDCQSQRTLK